MDRSFLADDGVVAASRKFVCIRLATYESAAENALLKTVFAPRGNLQNTVFAIMAPDGKTQLVRAGRSPVWAFGGKAGPGINAQPVESLGKMATMMEAISSKYPGKENVANKSVPYLADVRLALNVSACDKQPLVVVYNSDPKQREAMEKTLAPLAWSDSLIGQFQYVSATNAKEFKSISGATVDSGFVVIQPDTFGVKGEVLDVVAADADRDSLGKALSAAMGKHKPSTLSYEAHRRKGSQEGIKWETATPVTDGHSPRR